MSKQETNYKECNGCKSNETECALKPYFIDNQGNKRVCPCSICLVKGICKAPCDDYNLYGVLMYNTINIGYKHES